MNFKINEIKFKHNGTSILDDVLDQGFVLPYNCRDGRCKNCEIFDPITSMKILSCQTKPTLDASYIADNLEDLVLPKNKNIPVKFHNVTISGNFNIIKLKFSQKINIDFLPGQYIDLYFGNFKRSYSIYKLDNLNKVIELLVSPVTDGRANSYFLDEINIGNVLRADIPLGSFTYRKINGNSQSSVFICTGSGIAPIINIWDNFESELKKSYIYWGIRQKCEISDKIIEHFGSSIKVFYSQESKIRNHHEGRVTWESIENKDIVDYWYLAGNPNMLDYFLLKIKTLSHRPKAYLDYFNLS